MKNPKYPIDKQAFSSREAAEFLSMSLEWLRKQRREDRKRMDAGLGPQGPIWVEIGEGAPQQRNIRYMRSDLLRFLQERRAISSRVEG
jgi:hypothetical protein